MTELETTINGSTLVDWYDKWYETTEPMRDRALRAVQFYHGKQFTTEEKETLANRGQPANVYNEIKPSIDALIGVEKQQRTDPRAYPRTPFHEEDGEAVTDALRYVVENNKYNRLRRGVWKDLLLAGWGGIQRTLVGRPNGDVEIALERNQYDRMWWDVHSSEPDFSDARYRGLIQWMDFDLAIADYGEEAREALEGARRFPGADHETSLHSDRPRRQRWYEAKTRRVAIAQVFYVTAEGWRFAEFTGGENGILSEGVSPFVDEYGGPTHPFSWQSAFVDDENYRYGLVHEMIDRQREINKRRSKMLHYLSVRQGWGKPGSVKNVRRFKEQLAKPDGFLEITDGANWGTDVGLIDNNTEIAGNAQLLGDAEESLRRIGASSALRGQEGSEKSGRAIQARQRGNLIQVGGLTDAIETLDDDVYTGIWPDVQNNWTAPKWIRLTDNEENVRFVGLNAPSEQELSLAGVMLPENATLYSRPVAEMDVDIIIEPAPDMVTLQGEQAELLVQLASAGVIFPQEVYIRAMPNLRNKRELLEILEAGSAPSMQEQMEGEKTLADIENKRADSEKKLADAAARMQGAQSDSLLKSVQAAEKVVEAQTPGVNTIQ